MEQQKQKQSSVISTGVTSLITVFAVLLLASFSLLILSNSRSDSELSARTATAVTDYYVADSAAEQIIADLDLVRRSITEPDIEQLSDAINKLGYTISSYEDYANYDGLVVSFTINIDENKNLNVDVGLPLNLNEKIERLKWQTSAIE